LLGDELVEGLLVQAGRSPLVESPLEDPDQVRTQIVILACKPDDLVN
jgi:hypothetical protein